jgi:hypothetical protein
MGRKLNILIMKLNKDIIYISSIIILIFLLLLQYKCSSKKTIEVIVPEKKGSFNVSLSKEEKQKTKTEYKTIKGDLIYLDNPINTELANQYEKSKDSIEKLNMYLNSIQIKEYNIPFEDESVKINNYIKTQGTLLENKTEYTIKEKKILVDVPSKETKFALYGGTEIYNNTEFSNFGFKGNIFIQGKKGNIISISYDNQKNIYLGYNFKIFDYKK